MLLCLRRLLALVSRGRAGGWGDGAKAKALRAQPHPLVGVTVSLVALSLLVWVTATRDVTWCGGQALLELWGRLLQLGSLARAVIGCSTWWQLNVAWCGCQALL